MAEEYYSFDKALRELKLRSEELKKLVSQGEIRAFRDKDTMKFRKEDIEVLAKRRPADGGEVIEELVFADEETISDDTGMATAQISEEDTLLVEDTEEIVEAAAPKARTVVQRTTTRTRQVQVQPVGDKKEGTAFLAAAVLTSVVLVYGLFLIHSVTAQQSTGMTQWLTNMFK